MSRSAQVKRDTKETQIAVQLELDGTGKSSLDTGIKFFDHMLDGFARHGLFDLKVVCKGDIQVDCHHSIEDTGIVLGNAMNSNLRFFRITFYLCAPTHWFMPSLFFFSWS